MKKVKSQRGQAIILLVFAFVGLVGFAALAIDGGRVLSDRRHAQNAADTAALAAALEKIHGGTSADLIDIARNRALSNGYDDGSTLQDVAVNNPPVSGPYAGNDEYIQVIITSTINTTFARVIGRPQVTSVVEAVARAQGVTTNPLVTGAALAAYKKNGIAFSGTGSGTLEVIGSGIFSNSEDDCPNGAMKLGGAITYTVETGYASPGSVCTVGGVTLTDPVLTVPPVSIPTFNIPPPSFTCSGPPSPQLIGTEYQPGTYNGLNVVGDFSFAPGNYCFNGNVSFRGNITANNVNFRMYSGAFTVNSNGALFTCSNMILHSAGGSGIAFNGGDVKCNGITFYLESGGVQWAGNGEYDAIAPTDGTYKGLLIYLPNGNTSAITINGNSGSQYTGTIIAVGSTVTINGNSDTAGFNTQILASEINFNGNATTKITYNPNQQFVPPADPSIELPH